MKNSPIRFGAGQPQETGTALVRYDPQAEQKGGGQSPPPEEIVIEVSPPRRRPRRLLWMGLTGVVVLALLGIAWALLDRSGRQETADLDATVAALVDARLTAESKQPMATATPTVVAAAVAVPSSTPTPTTAIRTTGRPTLYAETSALINVRSGPGEVYEVRGLLPAGAQVAVTGRNADGSWLYVETESVHGWVAGWLLSMAADPATADQNSVAILPAPPTPEPATATPTASATPPPSPTPLAANTTGLVAVAVQPADATDTTAVDAPPATPTAPSASHPCTVNGYFWLIHPVETGVHDQVTFRWGFSGALPEQCGFEVLVWREGETPSGVHDAVADNKNGVIKLTHQNEYQLTVPYLHDLPGVQGRSGDYYWTVGIVQIEPSYQSFGRQAEPAHFYLNAP